MRKIEFTRVKNDVNGNPRYVCHFSHFVTEKEKRDSNHNKYPLSMMLRGKTVSGNMKCKKFRCINAFDQLMAIAVWRANSIGGKKYGNNGEIVFQSYNIKDTERSIIELLK